MTEEEAESVIKEAKKTLVSQIKWSTPSRQRGGQSVGLMPPDVILTCEQTSFSIQIGYYRSQLKNKEMAMVLYTLFLDDTIK